MADEEYYDDYDNAAEIASSQQSRYSERHLPPPLPKFQAPTPSRNNDGNYEYPNVAGARNRVAERVAVPMSLNAQRYRAGHGNDMRQRGEHNNWQSVGVPDKSNRNDSHPKMLRDLRITVLVLAIALLICLIAISILAGWKQTPPSSLVSSENDERTGLNTTQNTSTALGKMQNSEMHEMLTAAFETWFAKSCKDVDKRFAKVKNETGGVFEIGRFENSPTKLYCDTETDGGGWVVFQRRMDGSVNFDRQWSDYLNGFGDMQGEYWLGLENLYQMTRSGVYELRIDMIDRDGVHLYAKYSSFQVQSSTYNYRLRLGSFSGNATDCMGHHNDCYFSTSDTDNDQYSSKNCASANKAGWGYTGTSDCLHCHLNGEYTGYGQDVIHWRQETTGAREYLEFSEMKFRKTQ